MKNTISCFISKECFVSYLQRLTNEVFIFSGTVVAVLRGSEELKYATMKGAITRVFNDVKSILDAMRENKVTSLV